MSRTSSFITFGLLGLFLGSSTGVAAMGGAVNGAYVFGPIGALLGVLISGLRNTAPNKNSADNEDEGKEAQGSDDIESSGFDASLGHFTGSVISLFSRFVVVLNSIWNLELLVIKKIGIVPLLVERPWLLPLGIIVLLFLFPPIGALLVVTGISAASSGATAETEFRVLNLRP